jgi:hypothetical protein
MDSKCPFCGTNDFDRCPNIVEASTCLNFKSHPYYKEPATIVTNTRDLRHEIEEGKFKPAAVLTGGSSGYYKLPPGATDLLDLIEHKSMSFGLGNIFKACYRLGEKSGTTKKYDLEKIIFFAQRELDRVAKD